MSYYQSEGDFDFHYPDCQRWHRRLYEMLVVTCITGYACTASKVKLIGDALSLAFREHTRIVDALNNRMAKWLSY